MCWAAIPWETVYRGPADLTLTYGAAPGLGRSAECPGIAVVVSRHPAGAPVSVMVDRTRTTAASGP